MNIQCKPNEKLKEGRCQPVKLARQPKKNSPFRLAEPYVFAVLLPLLWLIFFKFQAGHSYDIGMAILPAIFFGIMLIPVGFLIGWGVYYITNELYRRK